MSGAGRFVPLSAVARHTIRAIVATMLATGVFLVTRYPELPALLPVHFGEGGVANGWQYKTLPRVLLPLFIQAALTLALGTIALLLLSRRARAGEAESRLLTPEVMAATAAAETVLLTSLVWVGFQAYAAYALVRMWSTGAGSLFLYNLVELTGVAVTVVVAVRGLARIGRPPARPVVPAHWRFGQLYKNPDDPALFVPTRNGAQWTLNFGRPVAAALLAVMLTVGLAAPIALLFLSFRYNF